MDRIKLIEEEAINKLEEINKDFLKNPLNDFYKLHVDADATLVEFLENIGCNKIAKVYKELSEEFYYS